MSEDQRTKRRLGEEEARQLTVYEEVLSRHFEAVIDDVRVLARSPSLSAVVEGNVSADESLTSEFIAHIEVAGYYDQVRFIDSTGKERVRVDQEGRELHVVPKAKLQDKSDRYYFSDIINLPENTVYVSEFDLNIEDGVLETPRKPMIRIGMPINSTDGLTRGGILLVNFLGDRLLAEFGHAAAGRTSNAMLLNEDGYWLYSSDTEDAWGFMFPGKQEVNFAKRFPDAWNHIINENEGMWEDSHGIFVARRIDPLKHGENDPRLPAISAAPELIGPTWFAVAHIDSRIIAEMRESRIRERIYTVIVAIATSFLISVMLANTIDSNRKYRLELEQAALYDPLTKLPNRLLVSDRFEMFRASAVRTKTMVTLLFIDLDWFKEVNDTHGHEAGDELLVQVAGRMTDTLRSTDTVARLGGDEFVVLLADCSSEDFAERGAYKLLTALHQPFGLKAAEVKIGASIGVCIAAPHRNLNLEEMLKCADAAMYEAKRKGKGSIEIALRDDSVQEN